MSWINKLIEFQKGIMKELEKKDDDVGTGDGRICNVCVDSSVGESTPMPFASDIVTLEQKEKKECAAHALLKLCALESDHQEIFF